jgi:hypothetical protein
MNDARNASTVSGNLPDEFDRTVGALDGLPNSVRTGQATIHTTTPMLGLAETWVIHTVRQRDGDEKNVRDTVFVQRISGAGALRIALPPAVATVIARQRDALTSKSRSKAGRARAEADKKNGIKPGFLRKTK